MPRAKSKTTTVTKPKSLAATNSKAKTADKSSANIGFEAKLWLTADKLRNNMDAAEYKHVVLGLIFLKYISDAFEERHNRQIGDIAVYGQASDATVGDED